MANDSEYWAVYRVRNDHTGAQDNDGGRKRDLEQLKRQASGIVRNWSGVLVATVYGYPSRKPIITFRKDGSEIPYLY